MPIVGAPSTTAQIVLDPITEAATNAEVAISEGSNYLFLAHAYPTPPLAAQWASSVSTEGAVLSSIRHENRTITLTVEAIGLGALYDLEQKIAKFYREGGTYKLIYADGRTIVFDVLTVSNYDTTFAELHHFGGRTPITITLECKPYGRGAEITLTDHAETTLPVLTFTEATVAGDMPALGRLVIDNDEIASNMGWGVWGIRSRYYSNAATAALFYQAEACAGATGGAVTAVGPTGASGTGSNVRRHTSLISGTWLPMSWIGTSATAQTHVGTYRVFARFQAPATNTGTVSVRASWSPHIIATGTPTVTSNTPVAVRDGSGTPIEGFWVIADLGLVTLPKATVGNQGWLGVVEATSTITGDDVDMDYVTLVPVDEGYGEWTATVAPADSIQVAHNGASRSVPGGYWTSPTKYEGSYLLIPPSGLEARTLEVFVKQTNAQRVTGNTSLLTSDSVIPDTSARLYVTPRFLVVPST